MFKRGVTRAIVLAALLVLAVSSSACSGKDEPPPPPPTEALIRVADSVTGGPVAGASVLVGGAWRQTGTDGSLLVELPPDTYGYRVHAAGHVPVPRPLTPVPSFGLAESQTTEIRVVVDPRTGAQPAGDVRGTVTKDGAPLASALVVAVGVRSYASYTDDAGAYVIPGLDAGTYIVRARMAGADGPAKSGVRVADGESADGVDIALSAAAGVTVSGMIDGGTGTSSVALLEPRTGRVVPGLSSLATLGTQYAIDGVPPGTYELVAAFETDAYVMDPEPIRADGGLPEIEVMDADETQDFGVAPTIDGLRPVGTATSATPQLSWAPFTGADYYVPEVRDASGRVVWGGFDAAGRWSVRAIATERLAYAGPDLTPGLLHTFRIFAARQDPVVPSNFELLAASEVQGAAFRVRP